MNKTNQIPETLCIPTDDLGENEMRVYRAGNDICVSIGPADERVHRNMVRLRPFGDNHEKYANLFNALSEALTQELEHQRAETAAPSVGPLPLDDLLPTGAAPEEEEEDKPILAGDVVIVDQGNKYQIGRLAEREVYVNGRHLPNMWLIKKHDGTTFQANERNVHHVDSNWVKRNNIDTTALILAQFSS